MWLFLVVVLGVILAVFLLKTIRVSKRYMEVDWGHPKVNFLDGTVRLFCRRYHRLNADLVVPLPDKGPAIVVANHISGIDPLVLVALTRRPLRFLIAREQYVRPGLRRIFKAAGCIPVDRERRPEKALRAAYEALENGEVVALFPEGGIHWPPGEGKVKGGAVKMAMKHNTPIYPVLIKGVAFPGFTLLSLPIRSHLEVEIGEPIICDDENSYQEYVDRLSQLLKNVKHVN